jgi:hypothetical protein
MSTAVFLDTQVYLHYQLYDQINWPDVLRSPEVTIVVPPVTVRELNKHKELHPRRRVKNRASLVLKRLFSLFESASRARISDNVEMWLEDRDPTIDLAAFGLSRDIQDDNLIASIIMFRDEHPETEVVLVTSDAGLTLVAKANRLGIATTRLPDRFKLPEQPDPEQARIRELERELHELKLQVPQLSLVFEDGRQHTVFTLPQPAEPTEDQIAEEVTTIKQRYPRIEPRPQPTGEVPEHLVPMAEAIAALRASTGNTISSEDIDDYNTRLGEFYRDYAEYLRRSIQHQNLERKTIRLQVFVANDGTAPAEDIDVFMHFPGGFRLTDTERFPSPPTRPEPPQRPRTPMEKLHDTIQRSVHVPAITAQVPGPVLSRSNVSAPTITKTGSYDVTFHVHRVKHKLQEPAEALYVVFQSFEGAQSFHIDYDILAANVPSEVTGQLHVIVEKD